MQLEVGTRLGPYTILGLLGEGGMGTVYEARHEGERSSVALKFMHPWVAANTGLLARFRREAEIGQRLDHPGIVKVLELFEDDGQLALVMEFIPGQSLTDLVADGPLPTARTVGILTQLAAALTQLHSQDIVHRDLKPDNVRITPDGRAVVLDFGIARAGESTHTRTGTGLGTVHYMAPEQYLDAKRVDSRADIYALGVISLQLFTGRLPWSDATSEFEVLAAKKEGRVDLGGMSAALAEVVGVAIAPELEDRFRTATAMANALQAASRPAPVPKNEPEPEPKPEPEPEPEKAVEPQPERENENDTEGSGFGVELLFLALSAAAAIALGSLGSFGVWTAAVLTGPLGLAVAVALAAKKRVPVALATAAVAVPVVAAARATADGAMRAVDAEGSLSQTATGMLGALDLATPLALAGCTALVVLMGAMVGGLRSRSGWLRSGAGAAVLTALVVGSLGAAAVQGQMLGPQPLIIAGAALLFGLPGTLALAGGGSRGSHAAATGGVVTALALGLAAMLPILESSTMVWEAVSFASDETRATLLAAGESVVRRNRVVFWLTFGLAGLFATSGLAAARGGRAPAALTLLGLPLLLNASDITEELAVSTAARWAQALPADIDVPDSTAMRSPRLARSLQVPSDRRMTLDGEPVHAEEVGDGALLLVAAKDVSFGTLSPLLRSGPCELDAVVVGDRWPASVTFLAGWCSPEAALNVHLSQQTVTLSSPYSPGTSRVIDCPDWDCSEALNGATATFHDLLPDEENARLMPDDDVPWEAVIMAADALRADQNIAWDPTLYFPYVSLGQLP
jgi:hypothetical protein